MLMIILLRKENIMLLYSQNILLRYSDASHKVNSKLGWKYAIVGKTFKQCEI